LTEANPAMGSAFMLKQKRRLYMMVAFAAPILLYGIVMLAAHVMPFGNQTMLLWDANHQYSAYMSYWQQVLLGTQDGAYSFKFALGGNMAGLIAYYLASPLNLLLLIAPTDNMPLVYSLLILMKIGFCGLTFYILLRAVYRCSWMGLLFSTSYALMGFVAVYGWTVMWLDALIALPLVVLGLHRLVRNKKLGLYIAALAYTLFSQFYIGYMVCLFSCLYFAYLLIQKAMRMELSLRSFAHTIVRFLGASLLAAGLSAVLLIPAYLSISQGYTLFDASLLSFTRMQSTLDILTKVYTASVSTVQLRSGLPNIYIGIPLLVFAALYLFNPNVPLRNRLLSLGLLAVFWASFQYSTLYYIWHAFDVPQYFPSRFSFLFSFILLELAWQGFADRGEIPFSSLKRIAGGMTVAFVLLTALLFRPLSVEYLAYKTIVMDVLFFALTCLLLCLERIGRRRLILLSVCAMQLICLLLNSYYALVRLKVIWSTTADDYTVQIEESKALVTRIEQQDDSLYRMEFNFHRTSNDPFVLGNAGLTHYSSVINTETRDFARQVGLLFANAHILYNAGTTPVLDSLLGVKYILRKQEYALTPLPDQYRALWTQGDVTAYENPYALPFAYLVPQQTKTLDNTNPFVNQNLLLSDLTGEPATVFTPVWDIDRWLEDDWEVYEFLIQANKTLYLSSQGEMYQLNGGDILPKEYYRGMVPLPISGEDTTYQLRMTQPYGIDLAYFDEEQFTQAYAVLAHFTANVDSDADSHLAIRVSVPQGRQQLLLSLPYDAGWRVTIDGQPAQTVSRYGMLLALDLPVGEHTVEMRFVPRGLLAGAAVSAFSLLILLLWISLPRVLRRGKKASV
jgi:uncharacterized membrane protein YfhO